MAFIYDLTDTWNAGGTTFNAIKMNVTDSASAAASKLVTLQVGGSERFGVRKDGQGYFAGNVGIGTSAPFGKLHLQDTVANLEMFMLGPVGGSARIRFGDTDDSNIGQIIYDNTSDSMQFHANNAERMRIDSAGLVGIGTTSPTSNLHVNSFGNTILRISTSFTNSATTGIVVDQPGDSSQARIQYLKSGVSQGLFRFVHGATVSDQGFDLNISNVNTLEVRYNQTVFRTGTSERMRIDSSGNVGIGTSSPSTRLEVAAAGDPVVRVNSTNAQNPAVQLFRTGGTGYQMVADSSVVWSVQRIDSSGTVTATPLSIFSSDNAAFAGAIRTADGTAGAPAFSFTSDTNTGMWSPAADTLAFSEGGVEVMRITSAGNVGIGTSSPSAAARLDVSSTTSGFLPPRMTTTQRDAITSPPNGLILYNTTTNKLQVRAASAWVDLH